MRCWFFLGEMNEGYSTHSESENMLKTSDFAHVYRNGLECFGWFWSLGFPLFRVRIPFLGVNIFFSFTEVRFVREERLHGRPIMSQSFAGRKWKVRHQTTTSQSSIRYLRAAAPAADPGRIGKEAKQIGIKTLRCFAPWGFRPFSYVYCCEIYLIGLNFHL